MRVERLLAAKLTGHATDADMARWVADIDGRLADKLARVDLNQPREKQTATLGEFLTGYIAKRIDVKPATKTNWRHTQRNLIQFFGAEKLLADISVAQARDFERFLKITA